MQSYYGNNRLIAEQKWENNKTHLQMCDSEPSLKI